MKNYAASIFIRALVACIAVTTALIATADGIEAANDAVSREMLGQMQRDLQTLGYDAGQPDGVLGLKTRMAIGKFQRANEMQVDGNASFELAVALSEKVDEMKHGPAPQSTMHENYVGEARPNLSPEMRLAVREECTHELITAAEERQKKIGLASAITSVATSALSVGCN